MTFLGIALILLGGWLTSRIGKALRTDPMAGGRYDKSWSGCVLVFLGLGMIVTGAVILWRA